MDKSKKKPYFAKDAKEAKTADPTQVSGRPDIPDPIKVLKKKEE